MDHDVAGGPNNDAKCSGPSTRVVQAMCMPRCVSVPLERFKRERREIGISVTAGYSMRIRTSGRKSRQVFENHPSSNECKAFINK
jgi:hypothetical protein